MVTINSGALAHLPQVSYIKVSISSFFLKSFWRTHVLFWGHWYPCFGFLVTSPLGFKARVGSALFAIFAEANVMYIPQDSPLVLHLLTSWRPARSRSLPHMHVQRWDLVQIRTCNRTNRRRTRYHCASDPALSISFLSLEALSQSQHTVAKSKIKLISLRY